MRVQADYEAGCYTLLPTNEAEDLVLQQVIAGAAKGMRFNYCGRNGESADENFHLRLNLGGLKVLAIIPVEGRGRVIEEVCLGGLDFSVSGTAQEDRDALFMLRDSCFLGNGIEYAGVIEAEGKTALQVSNGSCSTCSRSVIGFRESQYPVCKACSEICEHTYELGAIIGIGEGVSAARYCTTCGTVHPEDEERLSDMSQVAREAEASTMLDIMIMNPTIN